MFRKILVPKGLEGSTELFLNENGINLFIFVIFE